MMRWLGLICILLVAGTARADEQTAPVVPLDIMEGTSPGATPATATPTPAPTPAPTPLAILPGTSHKPTATTTDEEEFANAGKTPQAPPLTADLDLIRIVRTRHFKPVDTSAIRSPMTVTSMKKDGPESELWQDGMMFQFELKPPEDWGLITVEKGVLLQVTDQKGQPLGLPENKSAQASASQLARPISWANPVDVTPERALIQLRCSPPPRGDERLAQVVAGFQAKIGKSKKVRIQDLRQQVGANLLGTGEQQNVLIQILEANDDGLRLKAWGQTDRLGGMVFFGPEGGLLEPYSSEVNEVESDGVTQKIYGFSFDKLPAQVNMVVDVYNDIRTQTLPLELANVPLP